MSEEQPQQECIFKCGVPLDDSALGVEMNVDAKGEFHGFQDHINHAQRVGGKAHLKCYAEWYERTYGTAFTIAPVDG